MLRIVNGFLWPEKDVECAKAVFRTLDDLELGVSCCVQKRTAVQAGGNCGVWPARLADHFDHVWTFEPDAENFECLIHNVPIERVICRNQALGEKSKRVGLNRDPRNCGAYQIEDLGSIEMVRLDDLQLQQVDFLCLDIEGYELRAMMGAQKTIEAWHPVIQIEDKGLSEAYGTKKGDAVNWLRDTFGYEVRHTARRDVILR